MSELRLRHGDAPAADSLPDGRAASLLRIRALLRKEMRQIFRDPRSRRLVFASPIIQLLIFGYAVNTDVHEVDTWLVDRDRTVESRELAARFQAGGYFTIVGRGTDSREIARALDAGAAKAAIDIPPGFSRDLHAGRGAAVQVILDGSSSNVATVAQGYAAGIVRNFAMDFAARGGVPRAGGVELRARAWYNPDLESRTYNVPAIIGALLMLMTLILTALAIVREREIGTLDQLMVSPLTPWEMVVGKTIPAVLIAFVDLLLIVGVGVAWFGIPFRGTAFALLLACAIYILSAIGLGLLISSVSRTQQEAFMGMFLFFLPALILSGLLYPIRNMPVWVQAITWANPVRHFLEIVRGVFLKGSGVADLWPQYTALTVMAALVLSAAVWRFGASQAE